MVGDSLISMQYSQPVLGPDGNWYNAVRYTDDEGNQIGQTSYFSATTPDGLPSSISGIEYPLLYGVWSGLWSAAKGLLDDPNLFTAALDFMAGRSQASPALLRPG